MTTITSLGGYYAEGQIYTFTNEPLASTFIQSLLERVNPLMLSLILFSWMPYARLVHSIVLTLKQTEFIQAARALGGSPFWIIRKHLIRNSTGPAMVIAARDVGGVVLLQATLTFINIGGDSVWGEMLAQGRNWVLGPGGNLLTYWWVFLPPTLAVMLFGIAWNLFGDSLNDLVVPASRDAVTRRSFWSRKKKETSPTTLPRPAVLHAPEDVPPTAGQAVQVEPTRTQEPASSDGHDALLLAARDGAARDDLPVALHAFQQLIERNRLIDHILPDLAQLVKKHPRDPMAWQTLGDALARAGDSQHATQSYDRARKLMQQQQSSR
jgi:hypothetical protein